MQLRSRYLLLIPLFIFQRFSLYTENTIILMRKLVPMIHIFLKFVTLYLRFCSLLVEKSISFHISESRISFAGSFSSREESSLARDAFAIR